MSNDLDISLEQLQRREGTKWTSYDTDVLPAWIADMDFPVAPFIRSAIERVIDRGDLGYEGVGNRTALIESFRNRMSQRYNWEIDTSLVMPTGSLIQAVISSIATFSQGGEGVLIQTPIYYPFLKIVKALDRKLIENPLVPDGDRHQIDFGDLREKIAGGAKIFLLCNPHNPTGRVLTRAELETIAALAIEFDLIVISDEIHADLIYPGGTHIPIASLGPEIAARTITLTSATKAFNIAGLKCAIIHFGSEQMMLRQTVFFAEHLLGTPNILGVEATIAAWNEGDAWLAGVMAQLEDNRKFVTEFLATHIPEIRYYPPEGSYLAWLDCSALNLPQRPFDFFLSEAEVAFNDGGEFSGWTDQCVRLNFATTPEVLEDILTRVKDSLSGYR